MKLYADLHIHSRYSRACSKDISLDILEKYAKIKGIGLLGTGDFTHPEWIKEIKEKLTDDGNGIFRSKSGFPFVLQSEISLMYKFKEKSRKVHLVLLAPNLEIVDKITQYLLGFGRIDYDGRPIFGINAKDFIHDMKDLDDRIEIIPAHIWTPWFGILGSKSGFDSFEEALDEEVKHIYALETGLSSDPLMNRMCSFLDRYTLISTSDMHSYWPWRLGREATLFETDLFPDKKLSYEGLIRAIRTRKGYLGTVEVDPNYGIYHLDGHRNCDLCYEPEESMKLNDVCPICGKPLTIGVLHRVNELSTRTEDEARRLLEHEHYTLIPLGELISGVLGKGISTKSVSKVYDDLIDGFGSEYAILLDVSEDDLLKSISEELVDAIMKNRSGTIDVQGGYDGVYGYPILGEQHAHKNDLEKSKALYEKHLLEEEQKKKQALLKKKQQSLDQF